MATRFFSFDETLGGRTQIVALPTRSDGVALALQCAFAAGSLQVPSDMIMLLAAIDARLANDRHSTP